MTDQVNNEDLKDFACSVAVALFGPEAEAVFHPERPRKQRCCIYRSESSVGGVHDMVQVACGETWKKAVVHAILSYRFQGAEQRCQTAAEIIKNG
jgi:hypothetical protein